MSELTRSQQLEEAREMFIKTGFTNNISIAYKEYCKAKGIELILLNTKENGRRPPALFDNLNRPTCPVCNKSKLMFRPTPKGQNIKVQLVCEDHNCDTVLNSLDDMEIWMQRLHSTETTNVSGLDRVSKRDPIPGRKYTWLDIVCPECGGKLYEMGKCCGAPEGLIECSNCDWTMLPSEFHKE